MPKNYILNSAVITSPGDYEYRLVDVQAMKKWLEKRDWESTIGYPETAKALELITGIEVPVNRKQIKMESGDEALVFRLTSRVADPTLKGGVGVDTILANCEIGILRRVK